jgi:hypothetical protein
LLEIVTARTYLPTHGWHCCPNGILPEAGFLSENFPNRTSETMKARPFQKMQKIFLRNKNGLAFRYSFLVCGNSGTRCLKTGL